MDIQSENSTLESTGDNEVVCSPNPPIGDHLKIDSDGSSDDGCDLNSNGNGHNFPSLDPEKTKEYAEKSNSDEHGTVKLQSESASLNLNHSGSAEYVEPVTVINSVGKGNENENGQPVTGSPLSPPETGTKGKGLKKWRRIRREVTKDSSGSRDVTKISKRRSEFPLNSLDKTFQNKEKSEDSVASTNALINNTGADTFSINGSSSIHEVAGGSTFSIGADSDNSKDRSSKSSTAASVPRSRNDPSRASGHSREKQKIKNFGGKHLGAFQADTTNKPWVEAAENSLSSLESDSRSYSSVFMQGSSSVISNGHSERLMGYDSEHGYDGLAGEQISAEGLPAGFDKTARENEELSHDDSVSGKIRGRNKNHQLSENGDPLTDCVRMLRSAQESLEQEIQKFGELGKDLQPLDDRSIKATNKSEDAARDDPDALEANSTSQAQNIHVLEKQLEEAMDMLKEKESKITELECKINDMKLSNEDLGRSVEVQQKKYKEIEAKMEVLIKQKIEAEIKYLAFEDESIIAAQQMKSIANTQLQRTRPDSSEISTAISKDKDEVRKMQKRAAKFSVCFILQLILFIFVLQFFAVKFLPNSEMVIPT